MCLSVETFPETKTLCLRTFLWFSWHQRKVIVVTVDATNYSLHVHQCKRLVCLHCNQWSDRDFSLSKRWFDLLRENVDIIHGSDFATFHRRNTAGSTAFAVTHVRLFRKIKAQPQLQIATAGLFDSWKFLQMLCSKHEVFPQGAAAASHHHCWENLSWSTDSRMSHYFSDEFRISSETATAATLRP